MTQEEIVQGPTITQKERIQQGGTWQEEIVHAPIIPQEHVVEVPVPMTQEESCADHHPAGARPMTQEEIVHAPTITQQGSITQQRVETVVEVPVPMVPEERDAGPRAQYVGMWGAFMSDDEGDEGHEGDADEPRHDAYGGGEGRGGASDDGRSTAENLVCRRPGVLHRL